MEEWPQVLHESSSTIHAFCITVLLGKVLQSDAGEDMTLLGRRQLTSSLMAQEWK